MTAVTLTICRNNLAALYGEDSAPNPAPAARDIFINRGIEDVYYAQQWWWRRTILNVTFNSSGVSTTTLTNWAEDSLNDQEQLVRLVATGSGNDTIYKVIKWEDRDKYGDGDNVVWITGNLADGYNLNIKETDARTLEVMYYIGASELSSASDTTRVPLVDPIAKAAYIRLRKYDDPEAVVDREKLDYAQSLNALRALSTRTFTNPLVGTSERSGHSIGDVE